MYEYIFLTSRNDSTLVFTSLRSFDVTLHRPQNGEEKSAINRQGGAPIWALQCVAIYAIYILRYARAYARLMFMVTYPLSSFIK